MKRPSVPVMVVLRSPGERRYAGGPARRQAVGATDSVQTCGGGPDKPYRLTKEHGPWLILASSFAGSGAEKQARELVLELRQQRNLEAYMYQEAYDYTTR